MTWSRLFGRSPTLLIVLVGIVSYWTWCWYAPDGPQKEALRIFAFMIPLGACLRWAPAVWRIFTRQKPIEGQQLSLGIVVGTLGLACSGFYLLLWQIAGQPLDMVNGEVNSFWLWLVGIGYLLHLTAARSDDHEIPWLGHAMLWGSLAASVALTVVVLCYKPYLQPVADWVAQRAF